MSDYLAEAIANHDVDEPAGVMNGKMFLDSLRDDREIWYRGKRINDVTTHPDFAGMAHTLANIYDKQHDPKTRDIVSYERDNGLRVSYSYLPPTEPAHLQLRHQNTLF